MFFFYGIETQMYVLVFVFGFVVFELAGILMTLFANKNYITVTFNPFEWFINIFMLKHLLKYLFYFN